MYSNAHKQVFELSQDGLIIARDNIVLDCNESFVEILGYDSKEELLQLHPSTFSPKYQKDGRSSREKADENLLKAIEDNGYIFEWIHSKKSGEYIECEVSLKPIFYEGQSAVFVTVRDISQRKSLELSNKKLTERLELAFSASNDGIWDWNLEDNSIYFSPRWKMMLGYSDDEIDNCFESWQERVHPDDLQNAIDDIQNYLDGKTTIYESYHRLKHKDGSWVWILDKGKAHFNEDGEPIRFIGTHTDITKEKNLEYELMELNKHLEEKVEEKVLELKKSKVFLEAVLDTTKDAIAIVDKKGMFIFVNPSYEAMTGYSEDELYSMSYADFTLKDNIKKSKNILKEVDVKGFYQNYEKLCVVNDEKVIDVMMDIARMPDGDSYLIVARDVTVENQLKKERILQNETLLRQSRLAQMGEMISMIAHQWRQPLAAISTTVVNLQMKLELESFDMTSQKGIEETNEYLLKRLENVNGFVHNLTTTIDDFRNFYKPNKKSVIIKLSNVVLKSLEIIRASLLNDNIELIEKYNDKEEIDLYDSEMMQVVLNMLKNSQDNFQEKKIENPHIEIIVENKTISICDNGGGIKEDVMEKIFDPYFSTKDEKNGTGLGLYMSKIIVEEHHKGKLLVSNKNEGICFITQLGEIK